MLLITDSEAGLRLTALRLPHPRYARSTRRIRDGEAIIPTIGPRASCI